VNSGCSLHALAKLRSGCVAARGPWPGCACGAWLPGMQMSVAVQAAAAAAAPPQHAGPARAAPAAPPPARRCRPPLALRSSRWPRAAQVRVLSLDPEDALKVAAVQAVDATPESLLMLDSPVAEAGADGATAGAAALFLHTGAPAQRACAWGRPARPQRGACVRGAGRARARFGRAAVARAGRARRARRAPFAAPVCSPNTAGLTYICTGRAVACEPLSPLQTCPPG